jgi:hypothetical protein
MFRSGFIDSYLGTASVSNLVMRATAYTEQSSNAQRSLVSSSANDASAGTGARTVLVTYYPSDLSYVATETVTMNGTTPVNMVATDVCYIEKLEVLSAGNTGGNVGTISLMAATGGGGATIWSIAAGGDNKTFGAHHYVLAAHTCTIRSICITAKSQSYLIRGRTINVTVANSNELQCTPTMRSVTGSNSNVHEFGFPLEINGPARITMYTQADSTAAGTAFCSFVYSETN